MNGLQLSRRLLLKLFPSTALAISSASIVATEAVGAPTSPKARERTTTFVVSLVSLVPFAPTNKRAALAKLNAEEIKPVSSQLGLPISVRISNHGAPSGFYAAQVLNESNSVVAEMFIASGSSALFVDQRIQIQLLAV